MTSRCWCGAVMFLLASCTGVQRQGTSPAYLIINALEAASGAEPGAFGGTLASDVVTIVRRPIAGGEVRQATVFDDPGRVEFSLGLKDPGSTSAPSQPSTSNFITVSRYHVRFIRADGRNAPGVDVPYGFDGAITVTVGAEPVLATFVLVRSQAKQEVPLRALSITDAVISTIAEITFYGKDQAGRTVAVVGRIGVNFADWADPED